MTHLLQKESSNRVHSLYDAVISAQPKEVPEPPDDLIKFRMMSNKEKEMHGDKFYNRIDIKDYLDTKWNIERHNRDSFLWLWEGFNNIKDYNKRQAIRTKMSEFKTIITKNPNPYPALMLNFGEYPFKFAGNKTEEQEVCDIFEGRIVSSEQKGPNESSKERVS